MNNRGLLRRSVAAAAAVLAVTAVLLTPVGPALAAETTQAGAIATESNAEPAIELVPGFGNTVAITMTNGIGLTARLNITIDGKDSVWTAPAAATTASYTVLAPYKVAVAGVVQLQAVALKNGAEVAWGAGWSVWAQPGTGSTVPTIEFGEVGYSSSPVKTVAFTKLGLGLTGTTAVLQRLDAGTWKTVFTSPALAPDVPWVHFPAAYTFKAEGSAPFRALLISAGKTIATSPTRTLAYKREATQVDVPFIYLNLDPTGTKLFAKAGGRVAAGTQFDQTYRLTNSYTDRTGQLQVLRGSTWATVQKLSFTRANGHKAMMKTPLMAGTVVRKYRVTIDATVQEKAWTSAVSTIEHMDPAQYTGYKKTAYNYMKRYCPRQVITLIPGTMSHAYSPTRQIQMATGYRDQASLKFVSLHECAHILSFKVYNDDYNQLTKRMNAIYGTRRAAGIEQLADCMASAMGGDIRRSGYRTTNCTGARADAARKILAGKKP